MVIAEYSFSHSYHHDPRERLFGRPGPERRLEQFGQFCLVTLPKAPIVHPHIHVHPPQDDGNAVYSWITFPLCSRCDHSLEFAKPGSSDGIGLSSWYL